MREFAGWVSSGLVAISLATHALAQVEVIDYFQWPASAGGNGHYYGHARVRISDATFKQASTAAVAIGGHLTTISNASENEFVRATIGGGLGLFHEPNGPWQNINGEPVTFFNWSAGQPDSPNQLAFAAYCCHPASTWSDYTDADLGNPMDPWTGFALEWDADCNGDGLVDFGQIKSGQLADDNTNGIPDICETSITGVLPPSVPAQGGSTITINGRNFPAQPSVLVGGVAATNIVRVSDSRLTAVTPPLLPGMAPLTVNGFTLPDAIYIRPECGSDLDQNGVVDAGDISIILLDFGPCYEGLQANGTQSQDPPELLAAEPAPKPVTAK
jgi:hypothetical protein